MPVLRLPPARAGFMIRVVNPWGEVIARAGKGEQIITADLDYDFQDNIRRDMPVHLQGRLS